MQIHRRGLLTGLGGAGLAAAARHDAAAQAPVAFRHGVASGDPLTDRVILWTRLTVSDGSKPSVAWQIATDSGFRTIVRKGAAPADKTRDYTIKVDVTGLKPGVEYHYRFLCGGVISTVGRTRTLPSGPTPDAVLGVVSCQLYPGGLFNAYEALSKLDRLDAVVHLGDYIYEYGADADDYGVSTGAALGRLPDPPHEIVTLADYRLRHAQYKTDPDLQAAHARAAFICEWDDHETANDSWVSGAENHQPETEGDWNARKAVALKAYYEWMPIREPVGNVLAINRQFDFGDLASLFMVETRLTARSQQLTYADNLPFRAGPDGQKIPDVAAFQALRNAADRELLGSAQQAWLEDGMTRSHKAGRPWQVLGNQVVMAEVFGPDAEALMGTAAAAELIASLPSGVREQVAQSMGLFKLGVPYNLDSWDGYPAARNRLYDSFVRSGARPIVLSGDSHAFWVNQLKTQAGKTVAVELGTSGITSPSPGDSLPQFPLGEALAARNDQVEFCDQRAKGFIVLTLTKGEAKADLHTVSTILAKPYVHSVLKRYTIPADPAQGHLREA